MLKQFKHWFKHCLHSSKCDVHIFKYGVTIFANRSLDHFKHVYKHCVNMSLSSIQTLNEHVFKHGIRVIWKGDLLKKKYHRNFVRYIFVLFYVFFYAKKDSHLKKNSSSNQVFHLLPLYLVLNFSIHISSHCFQNCGSLLDMV